MEYTKAPNQNMEEQPTLCLELLSECQEALLRGFFFPFLVYCSDFSCFLTIEMGDPFRLVSDRGGKSSSINWYDFMESLHVQNTEKLLRRKPIKVQLKDMRLCYLF